MDINSLLSKLGASAKDAVYLSITPGIGVEIIKLDSKTKSIKSYSHRPLKYNTLLREIEDFDEFKETILKLFEDIGVSSKCNVAISIPTVHFGTKEVPNILTEEAVQEVLTSEVEQAFIFKKQEPAIRWINSPASSAVDMRKLLYAAVQKQQLENIERVVKEIGAKLVKIELSLLSVIRALDFGDLAKEQMQKDTAWNLMLINDNGYSIYSMVNRNIVDYHEEFLAINSFEGNELYGALNSSLQVMLMDLSPNYLYVVSETDLVGAGLLAQRVEFDGKLEFIENNKNRKEEVIPLNFDSLSDKSALITLEAVGIGATDFISLPISFNFQDFDKEDDNEPIPIRAFGQIIEISPNVAAKLAGIMLVFILIPLILICLYFPYALKKEQAKLADVETSFAKLKKEYEFYAQENASINTFDANREIEKVLAANRTKLMSYSALGDSIPKDVWLTYFVAKDGEKIDIKGQATDVEDIYLFFKNLKDSLINTKLKLHKLEMLSDSIDAVLSSAPNMPVVYDFEITNMEDSELGAANPQDAPQQGQQEQQQGQPQGQQGQGQPQAQQAPPAANPPASPPAANKPINMKKEEPKKPDNLEPLDVP